MKQSIDQSKLPRKDMSCMFARKCQLKRPCDGCVIPKNAKMYYDLEPYSTQYSADMMDARRAGQGRIFDEEA